MTATDWRTLATEVNQQKFADAQARLDDQEIHPDGTVTVPLAGGSSMPYSAEQCAEDEKFTSWYDRHVLAAAQDEFERQGEWEEFRRGWPEPGDGARIEWEDRSGIVYGAYRQDEPNDPDKELGNWYVFGSNEPWTWLRLVQEYRLPAGLADVTVLVDAQAACRAVDAIVGDYEMPIAAAAGVTGDFHAWTIGAMRIEDDGSTTGPRPPA